MKKFISLLIVTLTSAVLFLTGCGDFEAQSLGPELAPTIQQKSDINAAFEEQKGVTKACFTKRLATKPGLSGIMIISFYINDEGVPLQASINKGKGSLFDDELAECVFEAMEEFDFPLAPKGKLLKVDFGLEF